MNTIIEKFNNECTIYFNSEFQNRLTTSSTILTDKTIKEYKQCIDEQINFVHYLTEQIDIFNNFKSYENTIDIFIERLKTIHEYEIKQNELFEQILNELTKTTSSSKEERRHILEQIDELIVYKTKITDLISMNKIPANKLTLNSSDTFKNIL